MNKKYILGSIFCILLMLVNTQTVFINIVKSEPTIHPGDAFVGNLWISELDTSSVLEDIDYIGIGHVNASEDYVLWENGTGNITANWTVDIQTETHPEYCIMFSLLVFNVDDNNTELGNNSTMKTYNAGETYEEEGVLSAAIQFDEGFLQTYDEATVVCILNALVRINNTEKAVNFTTWAMDRCVIGVGLDEEISEQPFSRFRTEANANFSTPFAWPNGWDQGNRFDDEEDMLNTITYAQVGQSTSSPSGDYNWNLGSLSVEFKPRGQMEKPNWSPNLDTMVCNWDAYDKITLNTYINYQISGDDPFYSWVKLSYRLRADLFGTVRESEKKYLGVGDNSFISNNFQIPKSEDLQPYDTIWLIGKLWVIRPHRWYFPWLCYEVEIDENAGNSPELIEGETCYWEDSVAYCNSSYKVNAANLTLFGITTVSLNITEVLQSEVDSELVFTYAADRGEERIELEC
jgi:hypothetical protein